MSIRGVGSTLEFEWSINPTDKDLLKTDFDIRLNLPIDNAAYANDGLKTFIAPTATSRGKATYQLTLTNPGRYQVTLGVGTSSVYIVKAKREVYAVNVPDTVLNGTPACSLFGPEICISQAVFDAELSDWSTTAKLDCFGYDGDERIMVFGSDDPGGFRRMFITNPDLDEPTAYWKQTDLPGITWSGAQYICYATYSPLLDTWVIAQAQTGGHAWYCTGDPLIIGNWNYITPPTQWGTGFTNIMNITWDPGLKLWMMWADTNNFAGRDMRVSEDGVTWTNQKDYQAWTVGSAKTKGRCYNYVRTQLNGETFTMFTQGEVYAWKKNDDDGDSLPTSAQGWAQLAQDNGVIGGAGVRQIYHLASDGRQVVVASSGDMNASINPLTSDDWGIDGNSNTGWSDTDLGWSTINGTILCLLYLPQYARPWVLYHTVDGWMDATSIPETGDPGPTNAPDFQVSTVEPFATLNAGMIADNNYLPLTEPVGIMSNSMAVYYSDYDVDNVYGVGGWGLIMREDFLDRSLDFIVFQRAPVIG